MSNALNFKCRTCLSNSNSYHNLFDYVEVNYKILEMLDSIVPQIDIKTSSRFSSLMCQICVDKLLTGYKFQQLCIETNDQLHNLLFETESQKTLDPLTGESFKMKLEIEEEACSEYQLPPDKLKREIISHNVNYDVPVCSEEINSETRLHEKRRYPCEICNTSYMSENSFKAHMLIHTSCAFAIKKSAQPNGSVDCKGSLETQKFLNEKKANEIEAKEEELKHKNPSELLIFQCPDCPYSFEKKASLSAHYKIHTKKDLLKNTKSKTESVMKHGEEVNSLDKHQENTDEITPKLSEIIVKEEIEIYDEPLDDIDTNAEFNNDCDYSHDKSEKDLITKPKRKKTQNNGFVDTGIGEVEKPNSGRKRNAIFPCEVCGKVFDAPYRIKRHSSVHSLTRPHECNICKYRFPTTNILQAHMFHHRNETGGYFNYLSRPEGFQCRHCPRRFEKQASLSAHQKIHTHNSTEANYICSVCQRNFMSIKTLTEHITNIHPEVDKHKCDQCGKTFVLHVQLLEHLNHHKDNRNLVCLICEKEFDSKIALKDHLRTHSVENFYQCPQCGKTFRSVSNVRLHMERHMV